MNYYLFIDKAIGKCRVPDTFFIRRMLKECAYYYDMAHSITHPKIRSKNVSD